jgi:hypothetical protein
LTETERNSAKGDAKEMVSGRKREYLEPRMVTEYWRQIRGTLIRQFQMVKRSASCGLRYADALIILGGRHHELRGQEKHRMEIKSKRVVVVQAKAWRIGMYLMGQGVFSAKLMKRFKPKSVKSVMLCTENDTALEPLLAQFRDVEVRVMKVPQRS